MSLPAYQDTVQVKPGGFLPDIRIAQVAPIVGYYPEEKIKFSGRGTVEFPLPQKETDPIWVSLEEHPSSIFPYNANEIEFL